MKFNLALSYACEGDHTEVAEILLNSGAHIDQIDNEGRTSLMKAVRAGHTCTVQYLISKGADVNRSTNSNDSTVLSLACAGGHLEIASLLLKHGSDPNHLLKVNTYMDELKLIINVSLFEGSFKLFNRSSKRWSY
jgi:ankyrin repeat domain-containing protein 17